MPDLKIRCFPALLALAATLHAAPVAATGFNDALSRGQVSLTLRLRDEYADQAALNSANAFTLRTALGFTTAPWHGLQAMVEAENIASLANSDRYNAAGTNPGGAGRTVIADPTGSGVNQAWLAYRAEPVAFKAGRQRVVLDNARFVGDSGWRQNMQTFDAAALTLTPAKDLTLTYDYAWRVSRVFGNKPPQPDFQGNLHLLNAGYGGWTYGRFAAYAYLVDLDNSPANSSDTVGASFAGAAPVVGGWKATYRVEYAVQRDAGRNPLSYRARYSLVEVGGALKATTFGAACEVLGSDGGLKGFATPLATLHAFNGWADVFLNTPARGLRDFYLSAGTTLPGGLPLKVIYHDYHADAGNARYGHEWDLLLSRKFGKQWTLLAKAAHFDGRAPFADLNRCWLQAEFTL